jgi:hypothetical protein
VANSSGNNDLANHFISEVVAVPPTEERGVANSGTKMIVPFYALCNQSLTPSPMLIGKYSILSFTVSFLEYYAWLS